MTLHFNLDKALEDFKSAQPLMSKEGVLAPLIKQMDEVALLRIKGVRLD